MSSKAKQQASQRSRGTSGSTRRDRISRRGYRTRAQRFVRDVWQYTPFVRMAVLLLVLWLIFSAGFYLAERGAEGSAVRNYGDALYWSVAAFSTAGIAPSPQSGMAKLIGATWIILGSALFFGAIIATITGYFMRPLQRPHKRIIDTIEYNLEQLDDLSIEELDLLRETIDALIEHVEHMKKSQPPASSGPDTQPETENRQ